MNNGLNKLALKNGQKANVYREFYSKEFLTTKEISNKLKLNDDPKKNYNIVRYCIRRLEKEDFVIERMGKQGREIVFTLKKNASGYNSMAKKELIKLLKERDREIRRLKEGIDPEDNIQKENVPDIEAQTEKQKAEKDVESTKAITVIKELAKTKNPFTYRDIDEACSKANINYEITDLAVAKLTVFGRLTKDKEGNYTYSDENLD